MSLLDDGLKGVGPTLLMSVGAVIAAPIIIPAVMGGLRPLAKTAVRGYLYLSDSVRESFAEAGEQLSDMVAEVRAEASNTTAGQEPQNEGTAPRGSRKPEQRKEP